MQSNIPNLFVIGAAKSGTTSLYSILSRHPEVFMSRQKATRFFISDKKYSNGLDWYLQTYFAGAEQYTVRGEATPSYLAQAYKTAPRIRETITGEQTKFIAIFRNPIDRAYSHYWYNRNKKQGDENSSFEDALALEEKLEGRTEISGKRYSRTQNYFKNGQYSLCLGEYFKYFKQDQFLFLLFEDLFKEQFHATAARLTEFLHIENVNINYTKENQARKVGTRPTVKFVRKQRGLMSFLKSYLPSSIQNMMRNQYSKMISKPVKYSPMKQETRKMLLEKYEPGIIELEEIIGRDLSHWINAG